LNAAVAVSMLSTPLLMMLYERVLAPRFLRVEERAPDAIDESNPVIIAGFGRFGQVVQRVLAGMKIRATVVDHDPNQIELVRRFGSKAYYGDATRLDLLEAAGARKAKLLVVAVDDSATAMRIVTEARRHFRHLKVVVRAYSRTDAFEYVEMGVPAVRETFGSALDAAEIALQDFGYGKVAARRVVTSFRRHDEQGLAQQAKHRKDTKKLITLAQQGRQDLERLLASESGNKA
jgi:voltage-gated potassium channel Kch